MVKLNLNANMLSAFRGLREARNETLNLFRPMSQPQEDFFSDSASETLVRGGNRSGKSTISAVKFAAVALDKPIVTASGKKIEQRLPHQKGRPLLLWAVGIQQSHIGDTIHRLLFRNGIIKIVPEGTAGEWRALRPGEENINARPSAPLIPPKYIESTSWENRGGRVFSLIRLTNGTEIHAYPSTGEPKQGDPVDMIWIDEAIRYPRHYSEWQARLSDTKGRILWSSWPTMGNEALTRLSERAEEQVDREKPDVKEYVFSFSDNSYIDAEEKRKRLAGWTDDERRARDLGDYITDTFLVYSYFDRRLHSAIRNEALYDDKISQLIRENDGHIPKDWTRELILDPGTQKPAVLFGAIPPPYLGDFLIPYDEIYIKRLDAYHIAKAVYEKARGQLFHRFIIDHNAGRATPMGFSERIVDNYSNQFRKFRLECTVSGSQFTYANNEVQSGIHGVQASMVMNPQGHPQLRLVTERVPQLIRQLENYKKSLQQNEISDKPALGQKDDLVDALRYWVASKPVYAIPPRNSKTLGSHAYQAFQEIQGRREEESRDNNYHSSLHLGPGTRAASAV